MFLVLYKKLLLFKLRLVIIVLVTKNCEVRASTANRSGMWLINIITAVTTIGCGQSM